MHATRVADLSEKVEKAIEDSIHALLTGNRQLAYKTVLRDSRINLIFEGSSEVMHLFMAL